MNAEEIFKEQNSAIEKLLKNCNKDSFDGVCDEIDCKSNIVVFNYTPRQSIYVYAVVNKTSWRNNKNKFQENDLFKNRFEDYLEKIIIVEKKIPEEKLKEGIRNDCIETILGKENQSQVSILYQCSEPSIVSINYVLGEVHSVKHLLFYSAYIQLTKDRDNYSVQGWHSPIIPFEKIFDKKPKKSTTEEIVEQSLKKLENPTSCMTCTDIADAETLSGVVRKTIEQSKKITGGYAEALLTNFNKLARNVGHTSLKEQVRVNGGANKCQRLDSQQVTEGPSVGVGISGEQEQK